jgi:hypothetical protein
MTDHKTEFFLKPVIKEYRSPINLKKGKEKNKRRIQIKCL